LLSLQRLQNLWLQRWQTRMSLFVLHPHLQHLRVISLSAFATRRARTAATFNGLNKLRDCIEQKKYPQGIRLRPEVEYLSVQDSVAIDRTRRRANADEIVTGFSHLQLSCFVAECLIPNVRDSSN
jgi:hypothetical protein